MKLNLDVSIEEGNLILEGLGQLPFIKVYSLIGKIQQQARQQLSEPPAPAERGSSPSVMASAE